MKNPDLLSRKSSGGTTIRLVSNAGQSPFANMQPSSALTDWKPGVFDEICRFERGVFGDHDFSGVIDSAVIENAKDFLTALPRTLTAPTLAINADGTILLEWFKRGDVRANTMFSAIIAEKEIIYSLMVRGSVRTYGGINFSDESIQMLTPFLVEHFVRPINTKKPAAR